MNKNEYNGYTNKPTWLFNMWVDEYGWRDDIMGTVAEIVKDRELKLKVSAVHDYLKDEILECLLEETSDDSASFSNEILEWGLAMINWGELARLYLSDVKYSLGIAEAVPSVNQKENE